jgi:hypothetical protein
VTGKVSQGLAMLVFRKGIIVGIDVAGIAYDGTYSETGDGLAIHLNLSIPPKTFLVQGVTTGPEKEESALAFQLPPDFVSQPFIRINAAHGPVNVKLTKLRELDD